MMANNVYDTLKLIKLANFAKQAFVPIPGGAPGVDPAAMGAMPPGMDPAAMGAMPQGMPPGVDPAAMGAMPQGMPPGVDPAAMGMDPSAMAGMPPEMDPAAMGGVPPEGIPTMADPMMVAPEGMPQQMDPAMQAAEEQAMLGEIITPIVQQAVQEAMQQYTGGQSAEGPKRSSGGNKLEEQFARIEQKLLERDKILVAALRNQGIEIPLADILGMENSVSKDPVIAQAQHTASVNGGQPGLSEQLNIGISGSPEGSQPGKIASIPQRDLDRQIDHLVKLSQIGESLTKTALGPKLQRDPRQDVTQQDLSYLEGLYR